MSPLSPPPATTHSYTRPNRWEQLSKPHPTRWSSQRLSPLSPSPTPTPTPKPLSRKIDLWIWASLVLSLSSLLFLRLIDNYALLHNSQAHIGGQKVDEAGRAGDAEPLALGSRSESGLGSLFEALLVVIIFYNTILLILSSKERQMSGVALGAAGPRPAQVEFRAECKSSEAEDDDLDVDVDVADLRGCIVFWILAVSQSGLAAVGLYVVVRLIWVLGGFGKTENLIVECFGLVYALGEMGILVYTVACCIIRDSARCSPEPETVRNEC